MAPPPQPTKAPGSGGGDAVASVNPYSVAVVFACATSGFLFGYDIGIIDTVLKMPSFMRKFGTATEDGFELDSKAATDGNVVASFLTGCVCGAALSSVLADWLGRKRSILVGAVLFSLGGVWQALSEDINPFFAARALSGVAVGLLSSVTPLYLSEISAAQDRGRAVTIQQLMITVGILAASCVNAAMFAYVPSTSDAQWRGALGAQVLPGVFLSAVVLALPFSPRWLMLRGRDAEAARVLRDLRGVTAARAAAARADAEAAAAQGSGVSEKARALAAVTGGGGLAAALARRHAALAAAEASVAAEAADIRASLDAERAAGEPSLRDLLWRPGKVRRAVLLACALQALQQVTGINAVLYFAADLFERAGVDRAAAATTLVIGNAALLVVGTLPGLYLVEVSGRRVLLLVGAAAMALCHLSIFLGQRFGVVGLALFGMFAFTFSFSATWGPVVWVVQSEVIPLRARARGSALATLTNWALNAVIGKCTPLVVEAIEGSTYLIFASCMLAALVFVFFALPETMGRSLESMESLFERAGDEMPSAVKAKASDGSAAVENPVAAAKAAAESAALLTAVAVTPSVATPAADRRERVALAAGGIAMAAR